MPPKKGRPEGEKRVTRSSTEAPVRATPSQTAAGKAKLAGLLESSSPRKKARTPTPKKERTPSPKKEEVAKPEEEVPPPPEVPEQAEEKPAAGGEAEEAKEEGGNDGPAKPEEAKEEGGDDEAAKPEDDSEKAEQEKEKTVAETGGEEEAEDDGAGGAGNDGNVGGEPGQDNDGGALGRTVVIEYCKQCRSFKVRADKLKDGLEIAVPGINVLLNPGIKPRRGCFEVREEGGQIFLSLLDMKRPFKPMKDLDMEQVVADIVNRLSGQIQ